ncbi:MAG TPA: hypothetical protein VJR29_05400, partial [bacterium]|nr:hypothetical protein [bacterium]
SRLQSAVNTLSHFYPHLELNIEPQRIDVKRHLPVWLKDAVEVYKVATQREPNEELIYLIDTRRDLEFQHLQRLYKQLSAVFQAPILFIVDQIPHRYRPLFVRLRIPYIYKNEAIFAPELGLKFRKLDKLNSPAKLNIEEKERLLAPIGLKLLAGILTKQISENFTLKSLHKKIQQEGIKVSLSKLSIALNQLTAGNFLYVQGRGPNKEYVSKDIKKTWSHLSTMPLKPFFREIRINHTQSSKHRFCLAGESALANYSNLASPREITLAMTAATYRKIFKPALSASPNNLDTSLFIQIWKEEPKLFSINEKLNPVELFFSMRQSADERIQQSLTEMLNSYGLVYN